MTWPRISARVLAESEEDGEPIPKLNAWSTISRGVMEGLRIEEDIAIGKVLAGRAGGVVRTKKSLGPLPTLATAFSRLCDRFHRDCGDRRRFRTRGLLPHHAPPCGLRNYCAMTVDSQIFSWGEVIRPFSARTPQTRSPRTLSTAASILLFASDHRTPHPSSQSHSDSRCIVATALDSLRRQLIVASSETRSSPRPLSLFSYSGLPSRVYSPCLSPIPIHRRLSRSGPATVPIRATCVRGFSVHSGQTPPCTRPSDQSHRNPHATLFTCFAKL